MSRSMVLVATMALITMLSGLGSCGNTAVYCSDGKMVESCDWYATQVGSVNYNTHNAFYFDCGTYNNLTVINIVTRADYGSYYGGEWHWESGSTVSNVKYSYAIDPAAYQYTYMWLGDSVTKSYGKDGGYWHCAHGVYSQYYRLWGTMTFIYSNNSLDTYTISGNTACVDWSKLYIKNYNGAYSQVNYTEDIAYSFDVINGCTYRLVFSDGAYHEFICTGNELFDYDACIWVYGYTCGVDTVKLYKDTGGWVLDDSVWQSTGYDMYEMLIVEGEYYKISFVDSGTVVHNQTFSCTGDHVLIDFDRCQWIYPPSPYAPPYTIYLWTGYDYNIVVFKDTHGNFIENSQLAIYDKTDNQYIQRWSDASDGYALLGAKFASDHDVRLSLRTFDGIFILDTTYPANGSAPVGEEIITTTNWTIPIKYNLAIQPVDQYGVSLFDVFCGLSEYTPLNPQVFWGMDLSDRGYVPVTNCSGFAMCDIIAEKEGYADYKVEALNWTSKSALAKDYRHNIVMEEE